MMDYTSYAQTNVQRPGYNEGLRTYMLSVFQNMSIALVITALVAMFTASSPALMNAIFSTPLQWLVMLAPLGMVFFLSAKIMSMSVSGARMALWSFAALMGLSLSSMSIYYTSESIAKVFFITASLFGSMAIYGHTTKRDLSGMGSFLMMGVIGIFIASLANMFFQSSALGNVLSYVGVVVFTLLTAYDVQMLKSVYYQMGATGSNEIAQKTSIYGALNLYMDFINLFIFLLRIFGVRRS